MRGMMGGHGHGAGAFDQAAAGTGHSGSPWGGNAEGGELSRQAGIDDIGRSPPGRDDSGSGGDRGHGLFDTAANDADQGLDDLDAGDFDDDGFDFDGADSDSA